MKRWAAAIVAVLFLSTATLHVLSHPDLADRSCTSCHASQSRVPASEAPRIAVAAVSVVVLRSSGPVLVQAGIAAPADARAPPALPA